MPEVPTAPKAVQPLIQRPRDARVMLGNCGVATLYKLLNSGALESFSAGRARYITTASIERYIAHRLAEAGGTTPATAPATTPPRRKRGRPRKMPANGPATPSDA